MCVNDVFRCVCVELICVLSIISMVCMFNVINILLVLSMMMGMICIVDLFVGYVVVFGYNISDSIVVVVSMVVVCVCKFMVVWCWVGGI